MKRGDYFLGTFAGDAGPVPITYCAEVKLVDAVTSEVDLFFPDFGLNMRANFAAGAGSPWPATGDDGAQYGFNDHDIYEVRDASPNQGDTALLTLADGAKFLCYVESIDDATNIQLYEQPYPRLSVDLDTVLASETDRAPVGARIVSLQLCARDDSLPAPVTFGVFANGWWSEAARRDAHPGRVGAAIQPFAVVIHTTDMPPGSLPGLINRWSTQPGQGNGAHFVIGRSPEEGMYQLVSVDRNANHAGGPGHGRFTDGTHEWHPNLVSVGIELHCAGQVRMHDSAWRLFSQGQPSGPAIPAQEVVPNPQISGRGWQTVTPYQYDQLAALLDGLEAVLAPLPPGCVAESVAQPPAYGRFATGRVVGHVSLDADSRGDPWPPTCDWLRNR